MSYDNRGKVSLWKKDQNAPEKAPILRGTVVAPRNIREGEEMEIALWKNDSSNPKAPALTGKLSDKFKPDAPQQSDNVARPEPEAAPYDEEIPFAPIGGPLC